MYIPPRQFRTAFTPPLISRLIKTICIATFATLVIDLFFASNLQELLSITPRVYQKFFIWQPFTSLLIMPASGFSFGFLLDFAFAMLLLWLLGSLLLEQIGEKKFLFAYIASGLAGALSAILSMYFLSSFAIVSACLPALLAIATLWTMSNPNQQLNLFFILPLKAKWIFILALVGTLLSNLVQHNPVHFFAYMGALLFSYFYGLIALNFRSPFEWMSGLESFVKKCRYSCSTFFQWRVLSVFRKARESVRARRAEQKMKEDLFVDSTLEKISRHGSSSLSSGEKRRLKWVSFKKKIGL